MVTPGTSVIEYPLPKFWRSILDVMFSCLSIEATACLREDPTKMASTLTPRQLWTTYDLTRRRRVTRSLCLVKALEAPVLSGWWQRIKMREILLAWSFSTPSPPSGNWFRGRSSRDFSSASSAYMPVVHFRPPGTSQVFVTSIGTARKWYQTSRRYPSFSWADSKMRLYRKSKLSPLSSSVFLTSNKILTV